MVHFVGAGSGAADLITVRGAKLLSEADVVIYAGSLVNPALLDYTREGCEIHDSAKLTLEERDGHRLHDCMKDVADGRHRNAEDGHHRCV